jgi:hypothetical protein
MIRYILKILSLYTHQILKGFMFGSIPACEHYAPGSRTLTQAVSRGHALNPNPRLHGFNQFKEGLSKIGEDRDRMFEIIILFSFMF